RAAALQHENHLALGGRAHPLRRVHAAVQPPSTERIAAVSAAAAAVHRNAVSAAPSPTVTNFFVGCAARITSRITASRLKPRAFIVSGICLSTSGVWT